MSLIPPAECTQAYLKRLGHGSGVTNRPRQGAAGGRHAKHDIRDRFDVRLLLRRARRGAAITRRPHESGSAEDVPEVDAIPHTFTIDADGVLREEHVGDASIEGRLKKLVAQAESMSAEQRQAQ